MHEQFSWHRNNVLYYVLYLYYIRFVYNYGEVFVQYNILSIPGVYETWENSIKKFFFT